MIRTSRLPAIASLLLAALCHAQTQPGQAPPAKPAANPLEARWAFSADKGKTYSLPALPGSGKLETFAQAHFTVDDPAAVGRLWLVAKAPPGGFTTIDSYYVGGKLTGMTQILEETKVFLNGAPALPEMEGPTLYERWPIDPALLKKGPNTLTLQGKTLLTGDAKAAEYRLMTSPPDALALRNGPALGPIGEDYFTLFCRTWIPCELQVKVRPLDPAGPEVTHAFPRGTIHRVKAPLPKGTRKFAYTVVAKNGAAVQPHKSYDVRVPNAANGIKFLVMGQTAANTGLAGLHTAVQKILDLDPDFIIHTGSFLIYAYWDSSWDSLFFAPLADLLARKPMCVVPAYKDGYSLQYAYMFYHPTPDGAWDHWTWALGPVRFIGIEGMSAAANPKPVAAWFESVLKTASEPFLFDVISNPAYASAPFGRAKAGYDFDRSVLHPLLAKYHATASLGCSGRYEFVPSANPQAVPTVITGGVGSPMNPGWSKYNYCVFTIKDGQCTMQALAYETGEVLDTHAFPARGK